MIDSLHSYELLWTWAPCRPLQELSAASAGAASGSSTTTSTRWPTTGRPHIPTCGPCAGTTIRPRLNETAKPGSWGPTRHTRHEPTSVRGPTLTLQDQAGHCRSPAPGAVGRPRDPLGLLASTLRVRSTAKSEWASRIMRSCNQVSGRCPNLAQKQCVERGRNRGRCEVCAGVPNSRQMRKKSHHFSCSIVSVGITFATSEKSPTAELAP